MYTVNLLCDIEFGNLILSQVLVEGEIPLVVVVESGEGEVEDEGGPQV